MATADLRRAVNACLMAGFDGPTLPGWLARELADGLGAVVLFSTNIVDPSQTRALTDAVHSANPAALVAIDEEGGEVTRLHHREGSPHPAAGYLGRLDDEALTWRVGHRIGHQLRASGVELNLAPVADVNTHPRNPVIGLRSFGSSADLVARHVAAYTSGLQAAGVAACAKHFPGHGDTGSDSHHDLPSLAVDARTLASRELVPFRAAVRAGALSVMTAHILVPALDPALPATFSSGILSLLRDDLGFSGAIVSDALDMAGASGGRGVPEAAVLALGAGIDLLCIGSYTTASELTGIREHVLRAVEQGRLPAGRVLDAAARVAALGAAVAGLRARPDLDQSGGEPGFTAEGFWLRGPVRPLTAPVFLRVDSPANQAASDTNWGVGPHLAEELERRLPGSRCVMAADLPGIERVLDSHPDSRLVVQVRDLARVAVLTDAARLIRQRRPDAILVEEGWPVFPGDPAIDIATFGTSRGTMLGLIDLLAGGSS